MSEKDFDWNDDLDFESLADEKEMAADYGEPEDSFSDFEDLADYADSPDYVVDDLAAETSPEPGPSKAVAAESLVQEEEPSPAPRMQARPQKVVSPGGLGILVAACTGVGAVGMAGAWLLASGLNPAHLLDVSGFLSFDQVLNFQDHPQNLLFLVTAGIILLTLGGVSLVGRQARQANARYHEMQELLSRVTALRLDDEMAWTSDYFKRDPDTSSFVTDILGAWRLQQARQVRSVGLEGELRRLEKALREETRNDLADRYDHPLVGSLADAMVGWYDDRDLARKEAASIREKDSLESGEILSLIEDSRSWTHANREKVEVQGATLKRWAKRFEEMVQEFEQESGQNEAIAGLQGLQKELARAVDKQDALGSASLDDLVDRGSKLAFQIAMEVARLGPRGERLLPMSQSLEELTTQFRQAVAKSKSGDAGGTTNPQTLLTRLEQITVQLVKEGPGGAGSLTRTLKELAPASQKLAENLEEISGSFGRQSSRLDNLGTAFAGLASLEFDPGKVAETEPVNPPEGGLNITQNDPFGKELAPVEVPTMEIDPFGGADEGTPGQDLPLADSGISTDVTPGHEDSFAPVDLERSDDFAPGLTEDPLPAEGADHWAAPLAAGSADPFAEPGLPGEEERVYDLNEFGAVRVDAPAEDAEDRIYDLAEFGAVALT